MSLTPISKTEYGSYLRNSTSSMRKFVTKLDRKGAILPVLLLEATVTGGRTYQAYKRDGFVEARERVTEESLGAVFWLFGATMAGKLFDKLGQKFLSIPENMPDVGVDSARSPFKNYIAKMAGKIKHSPEYLANFAVGKTIASIITACLFIGYVVPKVNQGITKHIFGKMNKKDPNHEKAPDPYKNKLTLKDARAIFSAKGISINAVENFKGQHKNTTQSGNVSQPSFKGNADAMLRIVQNFEENDVWKLLGTDVGTVSGRTINARNNDERVEIVFRDVASIPFYCFTMPAIVAFMNKKDTFKGLNTKLNPMSAMEVHNNMVEKMAAAGYKEMSVEQFRKLALGDDKNFNKLYEKIFPKQAEAEPKKLFGIFNRKPEKVYRTINLEEFNNIINTNAKDMENPDLIKELAQKMSGLQSEKLNPKTKAFEKILTESQVEDVLKGGWARDPEFMKNVLNNIFEDKLIDINNPKSVAKKTNPLSNPYKYISMNDIEANRAKVLGYVEAIAKDAESKKSNVTFESMLKMNKRNMNKNGIFMALAMGVSALFLSTIIPKIQYYITFLRTGKNSFPGTENLEQKK